jgi:hypothetical protein
VKKMRRRKMMLKMKRLRRIMEKTRVLKESPRNRERNDY